MDQILEPLLEFTYSPVSYWTVGSVKAAPLLSPDAQWSWLTVLGESVECGERGRWPYRDKGCWRRLHEGKVFLSRCGVPLEKDLLGTDWFLAFSV